MCIWGWWDEEAETGGEEGPGHLREGEEEESATTVGINCADSRPGEAVMYCQLDESILSLELMETYTKLTRPNPHEANSALRLLAPAWEKIVEE